MYEVLARKQVLLRRGEPSPEVVESTGYWLHNLYSAYEDLFKSVAGFWENHVVANGGYHVSLLRRMCIAIPGVRPAVLSEGSFRHLDELRAFRHVFRHAYSYGLKGSRVSMLLEGCLGMREAIFKDLARFREAIARGLCSEAE
ncbi:MAG: hypothetical protein ACNA8S_10415 [Deferrisomatales bacterium]